MGSTQGCVVVIGGAGGIGSAVVSRYLAAGIPVVIVDKRSPVGHSGGDHPGNPSFIAADVTSLDDIEHICSELESKQVTVNHVVSLAGGALDREFDGLAGSDMETIRRSIDLNLTSQVWLVRALLPLLTRAGPQDRSVALVSSINALKDFGLPAYSAAKAGLLGLVRSTVRELGKLGIRINVVSPGTVVTKGTSTQPKDLDALRRGAALNRLTTAKEVADVIFALSHGMTAVTGQDLVVDCGQSITTTEWRLSDHPLENVRGIK